VALTEQALFGGEQRAAAVDVDAAAFEDHAAALVHGLPDEAFELFVGVVTARASFL